MKQIQMSQESYKVARKPQWKHSELALVEAELSETPAGNTACC